MIELILENVEFHFSKELIHIINVDIDYYIFFPILFWLQNHLDKIATLLYKLPKLKRYLKFFEDTKYIWVTLEDNYKSILYKSNEICLYYINALIGHTITYLETKEKCSKGLTKTHFHDTELELEKCLYMAHAITLFTNDKN